jgi:hypothetical protein
VIVTSADAVNTRPCAHCGRPVPQRDSAGRPFRYCRDNDDACVRAARTARQRQRTAPGLAGQVAQAFDLVDRLERTPRRSPTRCIRSSPPAGSSAS